MEKMKIEISWTSLWRIALMIAIAGVLWLVRDVMVALFLAIVISAGLAPLVDWLEKKGIPRLLGAILLYILILVVLGLVVYAVVPIAIVELNSLFTNLVELSGEVFDFSSTSELVKNFNDNIKYFGSNLLSGGFSFLSVASALFGGLVLAVSVAVISFYLILSKDGVEWFLRAILPEKQEDRFLSIFKRSKKRIGLWLQTQLLLSLVVGLMSFIGLALLGVKHAFVLGLVAGLFEIVPFVGPVFAGSLAVLVALSDSLSLGVYVLALFIIIQQVESQIIIPAVFHKAIGLHPVVVMASFMIGYTLLGFVGIILAVPVAVILQEMLNDWISIKDHRRANERHLFNKK